MKIHSMKENGKVSRAVAYIDFKRRPTARIAAFALAILMALSAVSFGTVTDVADTGADAAELSEEWYGEERIIADGIDLSEDVKMFLSDYLASREGNFIGESKPFTAEYDAEAESVDRTAAVKLFEKRLGVDIEKASVTLTVRSVEEKDGLTVIDVYEWTFYDYYAAEGIDVTDVSGFGVNHIISLRGGIAVSDEYTDEILMGAFTESDSEEVDVPEIEENEENDIVSLMAYNVDAAINYANTYWSNYNGAYYNFAGLGGDCANFVSQCLYAGGQEMVYGSAYGSDCWYYVHSSDRSATWTGAKQLRWWMGSNRGTLVNGPSNGDIFPGSPVFADWTSDGSYDHAYICVGYNSGGTAVINSHTNDAYHINWNYGSWSCSYSTVQIQGTGAVQKTKIEELCFNAGLYRWKYADLNAAFGDDDSLYKHWVEHGVYEGRIASVIFDTGYYRANNPDIASYDNKALYDHFINYGFKEKRKSSPQYDGTYYAAIHPDLSSWDGESLIYHFCDHGQSEGRRGSDAFDIAYYKFANPDLVTTYNGDNKAIYEHFCGYGMSEGRLCRDNTAPIITEAAITNASAMGYTICCKATDNYWLNRVEFPTWTEFNGQDDLIWHKAVGNGNVFTFTLDVASHNKESGVYITHLYAYDAQGNYAKAELSVTLPDDGEKPIIESVRITEITDTGYTVSCAATDNVCIASVKLASWSEKDGQDDIVMADMVGSGGAYTGTVRFSEHNNEKGVYFTSVYVYDLFGSADNYEFSAEVPDVENPVVSEVYASDITADGYTLNCTVEDNNGVTRVYFPTYSAKDETDTEWVAGTIKGNKASARINVGSVYGKFVTKIFAYDASGNVGEAEMTAVGGGKTKFMFGENIDMLTPKAGSGIEVDEENKIIHNISDKKTLSELKEAFEESEKIFASGTIIGTGTVVKYGEKDYTAVVTGDVDGDGRITTTDYLLIKSAMLRTVTLQGVFEKAADTDGNGSISSTDYLFVKLRFLKK